MSAAVPLAVAAAVFVLAFDGGGYALATWTTAAIGIWWAVVLVLATGVGTLGRLSRAEWTVAALLVGYAAFMGLSSVWSVAAEAPVDGMARVLLYAGVLLLVLLLAHRSTVGAWADGIAIGIVAIAVLAAVSRFFPSHFHSNPIAQFLPVAATRLSYPVNYWNGLAILVALGCPLLLRATISARRATVGALALAPIPVILAVVYLASSRTGAATVAIGILAFVALARRRWAAAAAVLVSGAAGAAALVYVNREHELVNGPLDGAVAVQQGRHAAAVVLCCGLAATVAYAMIARLFVRVRAPRAAGWVAAAVAIALLCAAAVAAHPMRRWHVFTQTPRALDSTTYIQSHLLSASGNWRWQFWGAAANEFRAHPLVGDGAGSFEAWWASHGAVIGFVSNPHSLYMEALGELGAVGLALVLGAFLVGLATALRGVFRAHGGDRDTAAAVAAAFIGYAVAAGVDWMWELPAVSVVGMAVLALGLVAARNPADLPHAPHARMRMLRPALVAIAALIVAFQADLFVADAALRSSRRDVALGNLTAAHDSANRGRILEPWAATPYLQLALVAEQRGDLRSAHGFISQALARDTTDWRLWLVAARIDIGRGAIRDARVSLDRARSLNPRSPALLALSRATH